MNNQQLLKFIQDQVHDLKATGVNWITLAFLEDYLTKVQKSLDAMPEELKNVEPLKAHHDFLLAQYNWEKDSSLEMFRSVITTGQSARKSSLLLNAGAAVALLTFIGHAASNDLTKKMVPALAFPLLFFVMGSLTSALADGTTYLTQSFYRGKHKVAGHWCTGVTLAFVVTSYVLFGLASWEAYKVFLKM